MIKIAAVLWQIPNNQLISGFELSLQSGNQDFVLLGPLTKLVVVYLCCDLFFINICRVHPVELRGFWNVLLDIEVLVLHPFQLLLAYWVVLRIDSGVERCAGCLRLAIEAKELLI